VSVYHVCAAFLLKIPVIFATRCNAVDAESSQHVAWNVWGASKSPSASRAASAGLRRPEGADDDGGSIDAEDIVCSACGSADAEDDNDILLCDYGPCGLAYHMQVCTPVRVQSHLTPRAMHAHTETRARLSFIQQHKCRYRNLVHFPVVCSAVNHLWLICLLRTQTGFAHG
jgi:hypothetical protein